MQMNQDYDINTFNYLLIIHEHENLLLQAK